MPEPGSAERLAWSPAAGLSHFLFWSALGLRVVGCFNGAAWPLRAIWSDADSCSLPVARRQHGRTGEASPRRGRCTGRDLRGAVVCARQGAARRDARTAARSHGGRRPPSIAGPALIATVLFTFLSVLVVSTWPLFVASRFGLPTLGRRAAPSASTFAGTRSRSASTVIAVQAACGFLFVISGVLTVASRGAALSNDAGYARNE